MRIFSSAVNCRRVARRISFTTCSAGFLTGSDFCPIFAPSMATMGQKSSPSSTQPICLIGADAGHLAAIMIDTDEHEKSDREKCNGQGLRCVARTGQGMEH